MAPRYIAKFDSAAGMLRALGRYLHGRDFPGLGILPTTLKPLGLLLNRLPRRMREEVYTWNGWSEAIPPRQLRRIRAEDISQWVVSEYPQRPYPAVAIGSSSGALVHLCAALGIPWLPQTFLIPVRRSGVHPDEPKDDLLWSFEPARSLLDANPQLQLHHMHDPNQDRLMIRRMAYFRVKRLTLGETYKQFLVRNLQPGGTILLSECTLRWPTLQVADRHIFQPGALGGAEPDEFYHGGPRVEDYLRRYRSHRRRWDPPEPDGERPEAEWGFEDSLRADVEQFAQRHGYQVRRLVFDNPEHLSPLVADLYRWRYRQRCIVANRLLVESFVVMEPWWTVRTGSVPFWMTFNMQPSARLLGEYLDQVAPFDEINLMLFSHGVESVGLVSAEQWKSLLNRARRHGRFIGVDQRVYPQDFATFIRYYTDLKATIPARYPMPGPLALDAFDEFVAQFPPRYGVQWLTHAAATSG